MSARTAIKTIAKDIDRRLGIRPWLRGEPRGGFDLAGEKGHRLGLDLRQLTSHQSKGPGDRMR